MGKERLLIIWSAGGLAVSVFAGTASAQTPVPPSGPAPGVVVCEPRRRPIHDAAHNLGRTLQDNMVGYPSEFVEPPPGYYIREVYSVMKAKADPHRFTLYRSDFLVGTNRLSPSGAARFNTMATKLRGWSGPITIEWSPETPGLAEARRTVIVELLTGAGVPVIPERVVVGPSPYPGTMGTDAANNYNTLITRDQSAPSSYSLSPIGGAGFTGGGSR